jgi:hypothetical protein
MLNSKEIEDMTIQSVNLYCEVCDSTLLIYLDLENMTLKTVIDKFLESKASKTDLSVLMGLINFFWDKESSLIEFGSSERFREQTGLKLTNPNLSRSFKSLQEKGFITKSDYSLTQQYFFNVPFYLMKNY